MQCFICHTIMDPIFPNYGTVFFIVLQGVNCFTCTIDYVITGPNITNGMFE